MTLRIGDLSPNERPLERLRTRGADVLTVPELLAILLGSCGSRAQAVGVGHYLMEASAGSVRRLATESTSVLQRVHGMGPGRVAQLQAAFELARRWATESAIARPRIRCAQDIVAHYTPRLRDLTHEEFHIAALDTQLGLERDICVSRGLLDSCPVHTREVFRGAIEVSASAVAIIHNHPSGDPAPSPEDQVLTQQLALAGRTLGIPVYDHIIIGRDRYVSFLEEQWL